MITRQEIQDTLLNWIDPIEGEANLTGRLKTILEKYVNLNDTEYEIQSLSDDVFYTLINEMAESADFAPLFNKRRKLKP